ncbi:MAG: hypothetical protein PHE72_14605 [candidate division Zixibacteria bacterium]|nr:hypothetical protein [candidate division Zixibacteria bacterium]
MLGVDHDSHTVTIVPRLCQRWDCPFCADFKARRHAAQIFQAKPERHIVLTVPHGQFGSPAEALDKMKDVLRRWANLIRTGDPDRTGRPRFTPRHFEYAAVWDTHEDGYPHAHLASWGDFLPKEQVAELWKRLTGATNFYVCDLTTSADHRHNFIKYLQQKPPESANCKTHPRRVTYSKHYHRTVNAQARQEAAAHSKWIYVPAHPNMLIAYLRRVYGATELDNDDPTSTWLRVDTHKVAEDGHYLGQLVFDWSLKLSKPEWAEIVEGHLDPNPDAFYPTS